MQEEFVRKGASVVDANASHSEHRSLGHFLRTHYVELALDMDAAGARKDQIRQDMILREREVKGHRARTKILILLTACGRDEDAAYSPPSSPKELFSKPVTVWRR